MMGLILLSTAALVILLLLPTREIPRPEEGRRRARRLLRETDASGTTGRPAFPPRRRRVFRRA